MFNNFLLMHITSFEVSLRLDLKRVPSHDSRSNMLLCSYPDKTTNLSKPNSKLSLDSKLLTQDSLG